MEYPDFCVSDDDKRLYDVAVAGGWNKWVKYSADIRAMSRGAYFDISAANHVVEWFAQFVKLTRDSAAYQDGDDSAPKSGDPFIFLPWHLDVIMPLYGWKLKNGRRRITDFYVSTAKKAAKTPVAACILLYELLTLGPRSRILSASASRRQAAYMYDWAVDMIRSSPDLADLIDNGIEITTCTKYLKFHDPEEGVVNDFFALSSKGNVVQGEGAACILTDELCEWNDRPTRELWSKLLYARRANPNALWINITTAGESMESLWGGVYQQAKRWLDGQYIEDRYYAYIREATLEDAEKRPGDPVVWAKSNPALGVTVTEATLQKDYEAVKDNPAMMAAFKLYTLNVCTSLSATWIPMHQWDACPSKIDLAALIGRPCHCGLDIASTNDSNAFVQVFPNDDDTIDVLATFWIQGDKEHINELAKKHHVSYDHWAKDGFFKLIPDDKILHQAIAADILEIIKPYDVKSFHIDRGFQGAALEQTLMAAGLPITAFNWNEWKTQSLVAKTVEEYIRRKAINHGGNPVMRFHASNVSVDVDVHGNYRISKARSRSKIDGISALVMALAGIVYSISEPEYEYIPMEVLT